MNYPLLRTSEFHYNQTSLVTCILLLSSNAANIPLRLASKTFPTDISCLDIIIFSFWSNKFDCNIKFNVSAIYKILQFDTFLRTRV